MAKTTKGRKFPPEPLAQDEIERLMAACGSRRSTIAIRNRALICVLWRGLLRIGEATALRPCDIDPEWGSIRVMHGKGDRWRVVGLDDDAWDELQKWLVRRRKVGGVLAACPTIFCTLRGTPMLHNAVCMWLRGLAKKAGVEHRVHAHGFRHTGAAEMATEGIPMHVIQKQLGHTSLANTQRYVDHLAPNHLIETMKKRLWKGQPNDNGRANR